MNKILPNLNQIRIHKNEKILLALLLLVYLIVYSITFDTKIDLNGDNYDYLLTSRNIAQGHGYTKQSSSGEFIPASWFPPGYPYILGISRLILGEHIIAFKLLNGLFLLCGILAFYLTVRLLSKNYYLAFSLAILMTMNSGLLRFATIIMSESAFIFLFILSYYATIRLDLQADKHPLLKSKWLYISAIASILACYTRGIGIAIIASIAFHWLIKRRWKTLGAYLAIAALIYSPYYIRNLIYGIKGRYIQYILIDNPWRPEQGKISSLSRFWDKILVNFNDTILEGFPKVIFHHIHPETHSLGIKLLGIAMIASGIYGVLQLKRFRWLFLSLFGSYFLILLLLHTNSGVRYVNPIVPFILFTTFYGLYLIAVKLFRPTSPSHLSRPYSLAILACGIALWPSIRFMGQLADAPLNPAFANYFQIANTLRAKVKDKNALVIGRKPNMLRYYSGLNTSTYPYTLDQTQILQTFVDSDVDFVILEQLGYSSTYRYLLPVIQKHPALFKPIMHIKEPDTYLFRFNKKLAIQTIASSKP